MSATSSWLSTRGRSGRRPPTLLYVWSTVLFRSHPHISVLIFRRWKCPITPHFGRTRPIPPSSALLTRKTGSTSSADGSRRTAKSTHLSSAQHIPQHAGCVDSLPASLLAVCLHVLSPLHCSCCLLSHLLQTHTLVCLSHRQWCNVFSCYPLQLWSVAYCSHSLAHILPHRTDSERDVFNEKPSKEEQMAATQVTLQQSPVLLSALSPPPPPFLLSPPHPPALSPLLSSLPPSLPPSSIFFL